MSEGAAVPQDINLDYPRLVLDTVRKMRDADAREDTQKYFTFFDYALRLLMPYIKGENRAKVEEARRLFEAYRKEIYEEDEHDDTKRKKELILKQSFADAHSYYVFNAFPQAGIVRVMDEGVIPFDKKDFNELKQVIRARAGAPSSFKKAAERTIERDKENGKSVSSQ